MAFDLHKNRETAQGSPAQKFELSKNKAALASPKSGKWIIGFISFFAVAVGLWYLFSTTKKARDKYVLADSVASTHVVPSNATERTAQESPKGEVQGGLVAKPIDETRLNHKVPVSFDQGSTDFNKLDLKLIDETIVYLEQHPKASIQLNGYASSDGSLAINQSISQARAEAFKSYLVSKGIDNSRINAEGKGISGPIASNATASGRAKNRRVEILIVSN